MKPEELRAVIARKQDIQRIMSGPNSCEEANRVWNSAWPHCPVCLETFDPSGVLTHKDPAEVIQ